LLCLWFTAIAMRVVCLGAMIARRLGGKHPLIVTAVGLTVLNSLILLAAWLAGGAAGYRSMYVAIQPLGFLSDGLLATGAFVGIAEHYPKILRFAVVLTVCFAAIALAVTVATAGIKMPAWNAMGARAVHLYRYSDAFWLAFLTLIALFFRYARAVKIRANAEACMSVAIGYFACMLAGHAITSATSGSYGGVAAAQVALMGGAAASYLVLAVRMTPAGEHSPEIRSVTEEELRESDERKNSIFRLLSEMRREL
jgi:hypothetical protein